MNSPEPSEDELRALWEAGAPLDVAWVEFARFFDRFALNALRTHPENDADVLGLESPRYLELNKGWLPKTWEARQKKLASTTVSERINLLGEIYSGQLWAIGFRTQSNGSDELVRVPRQFFFFDELGEQADPLDVNWCKGEVTASATSFFEIHVVRAPDADSLHGVAATRRVDSEGIDDELRVQEKRRPGRPTMRSEILDAIADYASTDSKLNELPTKRHRAYRSYLLAQGFDRRKIDEIGKSTFEKYETQFRKLIN